MANTKIYKGLMVLEEFKKIPIEGFFKIDTQLIKCLNKRLRTDDSQLWMTYIQSYGYGIMYLHEFLLMITKNNSLPYKDGYLVLKSLQKLDDPVLKDMVNKMIKGELDEYNTFIAFDRNLNDLNPIVGQQGQVALDKTVQNDDVNAYFKYLSARSTVRNKITEVYNKVLANTTDGANACSFLNEVQSNIDALINKERKLIDIYNVYTTEKLPASEQLHFDLILEGIMETFDASNLHEYYSSFEEFVQDHGMNNFVLMAEKKWALQKVAADDSFKTQCINNIFDEIFCNSLADLHGKKIYRTKDEFMISNYIDAIDNAIEMGFITNDEWGLSFLKDTLQQCFAMI